MPANRAIIDVIQKLGLDMNKPHTASDLKQKGTKHHPEAHPERELVTPSVVEEPKLKEPKAQEAVVEKKPELPVEKKPSEEKKVDEPKPQEVAVEKKTNEVKAETVEKAAKPKKSEKLVAE